MLDPYLTWLGIPEGQRPPSHYQLLGVAPDEHEPRAIEEAARRQLARVQPHRDGPDAQYCAHVLKEIARARETLLDPARRKQYDEAAARAAAAGAAGPDAAGFSLGLLDGTEQKAMVRMFAEPRAQQAAVQPPHVPPLLKARPKRPQPWIKRVPWQAWAGGAALAFAGGIGLTLLLTGALSSTTQQQGPPPATLPSAAGPPAAVATPAGGQTATAEGSAVGKPTGSMAVVTRPRAPAPGFVRRFGPTPTPVWCVAWSADGLWAVSGGGAVAKGQPATDCTVRIWDVTDGHERCSFEGHTGPVRCVAFSPDGRFVLSGSADKSVRLWDATGQRRPPLWVGQAGGPVHGVAFSGDGRFALSGGGPAGPRAGQPKGNDAKAPVPKGKDPKAPPRPRGSSEFGLHLWDVASGREVGQTEGGHTGIVLSVAFSPDGRQALSGGVDKTARVWDVASGHELKRFTGHTDRVTGMAFSPDGMQALSASWDGTVRLWTAATGAEVRRFGGPGGRLHAAALAGGGRFVVAGNEDHSVYVWEAATGKQVDRWRGHTARVLAVAVSPDGARVLTGGGDKTLRLWQLRP